MLNAYNNLETVLNENINDTQTTIEVVDDLSSYNTPFRMTIGDPAEGEIVEVTSITTTTLTVTRGMEDTTAQSFDSGEDIQHLGTAEYHSELVSGINNKADNPHDNTQHSETYLTLVSSSDVTQHEGDIDHNALMNYEASEHRVIDDTSVTLTGLWSSDKIQYEIGNIEGMEMHGNEWHTIDFEDSANKGVSGGYAGLDANAQVPLLQLPDTSKQATTVLTSTDTKPTDAIEGDKVFETDTGDTYIYDGTDWVILADADWENVNIDWANLINVPSEFTPESHDNTAHTTNYTDYDSSNFDTDFSDKNTDNLSEGTTNKYFFNHNNDQHTENYITDYTNNYVNSVTGDGNSTLTLGREGLTDLTQDLSHNHDALYDDYNSWTLSDGTNTTIIGSGETATFSDSGLINISESAGTITISTDANDYSLETHNNTHHSTNYTDYNSDDFDTDFSGKSTDNLSEGTTNEYFKDHNNTAHTTNYTPQTDFDSHEGSGGTAHANVTTTEDGFMLSSDKSKLDGIESGANDYSLESHNNTHHSTDYTPQTDFDSHTGSGGTAHADVTTSTDGFMTSNDKSKLNGIESGANNYSLESHNNNHHSTNYASESDFNSHTGSGGGAHSSATTTTAGFMSDGDKSKLNGIESGANDYSLETHDNSHHSATYATESWVSSNFNNYSLETHDNSHHSSNYTTTSPSDVNSSNWGDYEIQKNGTDGNGIINFKTE